VICNEEDTDGRARVTTDEEIRSLDFKTSRLRINVVVVDRL